MFYFYGSFPFDMGSAGASHPPYIWELTAAKLFNTLCVSICAV